jgi:hypothetical protein
VRTLFAFCELASADNAVSTGVFSSAFAGRRVSHEGVGKGAVNDRVAITIIVQQARTGAIPGRTRPAIQVADRPNNATAVT